jgi:hypothetical protein
MHSTHDVYCKRCGKNLAFWSGFGDNMQFANECQCQGEVWVKSEHYHYGKTTTYSDEPPSDEEIKKRNKGKLVKIIHHTREKRPCFIINETYFCEDCAKKLHYKCSVCKGKIKLTRKI